MPARCCTRPPRGGRFSDTVGILNTQVAGQSLFAGAATDSPALAPRTRSSPISTR